MEITDKEKHALESYLGIGQIYRINQQTAEEIANGMLRTRLPVIPDKKYNKADMIIKEVAYKEQRKQSAPPKVPNTNIEYYVQSMANVIRDVLTRENRVHQMSMDMSR